MSDIALLSRAHMACLALRFPRSRAKCQVDDRRMISGIVYHPRRANAEGCAARLAIQYGLSSRLVTLMVEIGIPLSIVTAAGWWWLLGA